MSAPTPPSRAYVRKDGHGVLRVGETRVMLDGIVHAFLEGDTPETIRQQYPALTLEEVYGAIAYYLANHAEVDAYLQAQEQVWSEWRTKLEATGSPVVERLRALRKAPVKESS